MIFKPSFWTIAWDKCTDDFVVFLVDGEYILVDRSLIRHWIDQEEIKFLERMWAMPVSRIDR